MQKIVTKKEDIKELEKEIESIIENWSTEIQKEDNKYFLPIERDYNDKIDLDDIQKILDSDDPMTTFYSIIDEAYCGYGYEVKRNFIEEVIETLESNLDIDIEDDSEILKDYLDNRIIEQYPCNEYLEQQIPVNLIVDTGDANYDFGLNTDISYLEEKIDNKSSMLWLAKTQGISKRGVYKLLCSESLENKSPFEKSYYEEIINAGDTMNALTFFINISLKDLINLQYKKDNKENYALIIDKSTTAGLVDYWYGAGSLTNITLNRDILIPSEFIDSIDIDGNRGVYSVSDIYGYTDDFWDGEIRIATNEDIDKWFNDLNEINPQIALDLLK